MNPTRQSPQVNVGIGLSLKIDFGDSDDTDWGYLFSKIRFKGMLNGGYILKATLFDSEMALLPKLIERGYFQNVRKKPVVITFQIFRKPTEDLNAFNPRLMTRKQKAIVFSMKVTGRGSKAGLEITAIDPPSWFLNAGDAAGKAFTGNVSKVIKDVIGEYTRNSSFGNIRSEVTDTNDAKNNKWHMMRQDPKTFIKSLLEWSSPLTPNKTQWLVSMDGNPTGGPHLAIKEQAAYQSKSRGYYTYRERSDNSVSTIKDWSIINNNALSIAQTKIVTQGAAATAGIFYDRTTDEEENVVYVSDRVTNEKQVAKVKDWQSTSKPPDSRDAKTPEIGMTSVMSIPEIPEMGLTYDQYIDGRARDMWLSMTNNLMQLKVKVIGHGEWYNTFGLGVDTVFLDWSKEPNPGVSPNPFYFAAGSWIVYGFEHVANRKSWFTNLLCARWDHDSNSKKVGQPTQ